MFNFEYYVRFYGESDQFFIQIFCHLSPFTIPVYNRTFPDSVLLNRSEFLHIYNEIIPYFNDKQIVIANEDLRLLYATVTELDIPLPELRQVKVRDVVKMIDWDGLSALTPKEMLMLNLINGQRYAPYIRQELHEAYQIDPNYYVKRLEDLGLIETTDLVYNLERLPYKEWVKLLEHVQHQEDKSDRERIISELIRKVDHDRLMALIGDFYVKLTPRGEAVIEHTKVLLEFHNHVYRYEHSLSVDEFYVLSLVKPDYTPDEIMKLLIVNNNKDELDRFDWQKVFQPKEEKNESKGFISSQFDQIIQKYAADSKSDEKKYEDEETIETKGFTFQTNDAFFDILSRTQEIKVDEGDKMSFEEEEVDLDTFTKIIQKREVDTPHKPKKESLEAPNEENQHAKERSEHKREHERLRQMVDKSSMEFEDEPIKVKRGFPRYLFWLNFFWSSLISLIILYIWFVLIV